MSSSTPIFISNLSEERWIKHITHNYTIDLKIHPCVFQVPQNIRDTKPEAYTPQAVGLGPLHHFLPELQQMESQKRVAIKDYIKCEEFKDFIKLVNEMPEKFEATIRCTYDRYLDVDGKTLSWIMVVDGIFLLHLVKNYLDQKEKNKKVDPQIGRLVPDILMLENQIPLKLLKQIRKALKRSFAEATDIDLFDKFTRFCKEQSPLKLSEDAELMDGAFEKHMLHYMYHLIVGNYDHQNSDASASEPSRTSSLESIEESVKKEPENPEEKSPEICSANICTVAKQTANKLKDFVKQVAELAPFQPEEVVTQVGDSVNSGYERLLSSGLKVPNNIEKAAKFLQRLKTSSNLYGQGNSQAKFFAQEIDVPSVSQLHQIAKIKFARADGGIKNARIDPTSKTLYLPVITLRANSEVILRNLVAYEAASAKPGSTLELTEYLDLMCGIIDTENDVKLLRDKKIIEGDLPDEEIVSIFNGIDKCTQRPDEKSKVQAIVREVNNQFSQKGIVKAYKSIKKILGRLQDLIKQLFPLLVLILLTLQYVCDIRGCGSRGLGYATVRWDSSSLGNGSSLSSDSQANYLMIPRKMLRYSS